jgi:NADH-quinone oxidoreductase subunit E
MSNFPFPELIMPATAKLDEMNRTYLASMPKELAGTVNLMVHPVAGAAAFSALSLGLASHVFGVWVGAVVGAAEASQRLLTTGAADELEAPEPVRSPRAATRAAVEELKETALAAAAAPAVAAGQSSVLMPEDFRQPRRIGRPAKPDDLKKINGIGPKLEKVLNDLGIWTYGQLATWGPAEIAWVDDYLAFKGRIDRDDWLGQAAKLAVGKRSGRG